MGEFQRSLSTRKTARTKDVAWMAYSDWNDLLIRISAMHHRGLQEKPGICRISAACWVDAGSDAIAHDDLRFQFSLASTDATEGSFERARVARIQ
jgi:hypothetical protein